MIPNIIHQIWLGKSPIPQFFKKLSDSWKILNISYKHDFWDDTKAIEFIETDFPQYQRLFFNFQYDIQRVDFLKYLILYKFGGVYVDMDYECLMSVEPLLINQSLSLGLEPKKYSDFHKVDFFLGNSFMASTPTHKFFIQLINNIAENSEYISKYEKSKYSHVMKTTGPLMLNTFYQNYEFKEQVNLISSEQICPLDSQEAKDYFLGGNRIKYKKKLENACAVHLFAGSWL